MCTCTCSAHGIDADSIAEFVFLFLMPFVLKIYQTTCQSIAMVKINPIESPIRMLRVNMSARCFTKTTEHYPDDHSFYWVKPSRRCPTERTVKMQLTSVWSLVLPKRLYFNLVCDYNGYINKKSCKRMFWYCTFYSPEFRWCVIYLISIDKYLDTRGVSGIYRR